MSKKASLTHIKVSKEIAKTMTAGDVIRLMLAYEGKRVVVKDA